MGFSETVTCWGKTSGRHRAENGQSRITIEPRLLRDFFDSGLMAKDKSEKKKKRVSEDVPPAAEEDVEMTETKVSNNHSCPEDTH